MSTQVSKGPSGVIARRRTVNIASCRRTAITPKPLNVLVGSDFATVTELADLGVPRISVGGTLARAAWVGFLQAAKEIAEHGTFTGLARAVPFAEINKAFIAENQRES